MKQPTSLRLITGWSKIETLQPNAKPLDFLNEKNVEDVPHFFYFIFCAICLLTGARAAHSQGVMMYNLSHDNLCILPHWHFPEMWYNRIMKER